MSGLNQLKIMCSFGMVEVEPRATSTNKYDNWIEGPFGNISYEYPIDSPQNINELSEFCESFFKNEALVVKKIVLHQSAYQVIADEMDAKAAATKIRTSVVGVRRVQYDEPDCRCSMKDLMSHGHVMGCTFNK